MQKLVVIGFVVLCLIGTSSLALADEAMKSEMGGMKDEMKAEKNAMKSDMKAKKKEMKGKKKAHKGAIKAKRHEMREKMKARKAENLSGHRFIDDIPRLVPLYAFC